MMRMTLIGDSIRIYYQDVVRRELEGLATVQWPEDNAGTSRNVLQHLEEWVVSRQPDAVHINCGLHDLKREFGACENAVPLPEYRQNVEQILRTVVERTGARVIWATTTPVNEVRHHQTKEFDRFEADVALYNAAAIEACRNLGVPVDDLYRVVMDAGRDRMLGPDGVHFTAEGCRLLGVAVANCLRRTLWRLP
jgi:lysophospholipase L1-like esterase